MVKRTCTTVIRTVLVRNRLPRCFREALRATGRREGTHREERLVRTCSRSRANSRTPIIDNGLSRKASRTNFSPRSKIAHATRPRPNSDIPGHASCPCHGDGRNFGPRPQQRGCVERATRAIRRGLSSTVDDIRTAIRPSDRHPSTSAGCQR